MERQFNTEQQAIINEINNRVQQARETMQKNIDDISLQAIVMHEQARERERHERAASYPAIVWKEDTEAQPNHAENTNGKGLLVKLAGGAAVCSSAFLLHPHAAHAAEVSPSTVTVTVKPGETLGGIVSHNNSTETPTQVASQNNIKNPNLIRAGERITVRSCTDSQLPITAGDTKWKLARERRQTVQQFEADFEMEGRELIANTCLTPKKAVTTPEVAIPVAKQAATVSAEKPIDFNAIVRIDATNRSRNITERLNGVEIEKIREAVVYFRTKGLSLRGSAYLTGNLITESNLNPRAIGDGGAGIGLAQWHGARQNGMPDVSAPIEQHYDFVLDEIERHSPKLLEALKDDNASPVTLQNLIKKWEGFGIEGRRFEFGSKLDTALAISPVNSSAPQESAKPPVMVQPAPKSETAPQPTAAPVGPRAGEKPQAAVAVSAAPATRQETQPDPLKTLLDAPAFVAQGGNNAPETPDIRHPLIDAASITNQANKITTVEIMGEPIHVEVAKQLALMIEAARSQGVYLTILDGYRSEAEQLALGKINGCAEDISTWPGSCKIPTAQPGKSNHQSGKAVDFRYKKTVDGEELQMTDQNNAAFKWLKKHALEYGFKNLASEPWHWSVDGK